MLKDDPDINSEKLDPESVVDNLSKDESEDAIPVDLDKLMNDDEEEETGGENRLRSCCW